MNTKLPYIVAIDFDGVLCEEKYPEIGEPNYEVINKMKYLRNTQGVKFILWTCRSGRYLQNALDWCKEQGIVFDAVNENLPEVVAFYDNEESRKISANEYWDDKAVRVEFSKEDSDIDKECLRYCTPEKIASRADCDELGYCPYGIEDENDDEELGIKIANDGTLFDGPQFLLDKYNRILEEENKLSEESKFKIYELVRLADFNTLYKDFKEGSAYTDRECKMIAKLLENSLANVIGVEMLQNKAGKPTKYYTVTPLEDQGCFYAFQEHSLRKVEDNG